MKMKRRKVFTKGIKDLKTEIISNEVPYVFQYSKSLILKRINYLFLRFWKRIIQIKITDFNFKQR